MENPIKDQPKEQQKRHYDYKGNPMEQGVPYMHRPEPGEKVDPKNLPIFYFDFTPEEVIIEDEFGNIQRKPLDAFKRNKKNKDNEESKEEVYYFDHVTRELALQRAEVLRKAVSRLEEYARSEQSSQYSQSSPKRTMSEREHIVDKESSSNGLVIYTIQLP